MNKTIVIEFVYFKPSGGFSTSKQGVYFVEEMFGDCFSPKEFAERLEERKMLPGLQSGTWEGPYTVHVHPSMGHPELMLGAKG